VPIEILMPALSPTMEHGTLTKWLVKEGDTVSSGDLLAEIETDKATMEFEAVDEGVMGKILIAEGSQDVPVNTPIAVLLDDDETTGEIDPPAAALDTPATLATAPIANIANIASTAPKDPAMAGPKQTAYGERVFASPLARRIAAEKGLDLTQVTGSGPKGRIVKADVEHATASPQATTVQNPSALATGATTISAGMSSETVLKMYQDRAYKEIALGGMRKTIAARLTEAKQTIPHFYLRRDIRLDALLALRSELNPQLVSREIKLSVNDFIIKASALALQQIPSANAVWAGDRVLQLTPSDVAVAVAIEGGLFTPVLKDAETKSLSTLSTEMKDLATRARDKKLAPHEYQGGSFAISNLGMFGVDNFDAVINPPHGAILAIGAGKKKPVVEADGRLGVATVMSVTMSVDHRVIDGALGAQLLEKIVRNLENPLSMLI
jgi:pyruvate dehydrogenase E2 component (dihydrolipoamide acetyltransferase)